MTRAVQGRTVALVEQTAGGLSLHFQDGATLRLQAQMDPGHQVPPDASVVQACERQDRLEFHFRQGPPAAFTLTSPGNAVSVRDTTGKVVYLG